MRNEHGQFVKGTFIGKESLRYKHGLYKSKFGGIFYGIRNRCTNHPRYAGRGIKNLWPSLESFRDDMYESYLEHVEKFGQHDTSIDRIDVNGHYCKENCRWATAKIQSNNRRDRKPITFNGQTKPLTEWCAELKLPIHLLWLRIYRYGWSVEKAFTAPKGPTSVRYSHPK